MQNLPEILKDMAAVLAPNRRQNSSVTVNDLRETLLEIARRLEATPSESIVNKIGPMNSKTYEQFHESSRELQDQINKDAITTLTQERDSARSYNNEIAEEVVELRTENQRLHKHILKLDAQIAANPPSPYTYDHRTLLREALVIIDTHRRNTGGEGDLIAHSIRTLGIDYDVGQPNRQKNAITELTSKLDRAEARIAEQNIIVAALTTENDNWNKIAELAQAKIDELSKLAEANEELAKGNAELRQTIATLNQQVCQALTTFPAKDDEATNYQFVAESCFQTIQILRRERIESNVIHHKQITELNNRIAELQTALQQK